MVTSSYSMVTSLSEALMWSEQSSLTISSRDISRHKMMVLAGQWGGLGCIIWAISNKTLFPHAILCLCNTIVIPTRLVFKFKDL